MNRRAFLSALPAAAMLAAVPSGAAPAALPPIELVEPQVDGGASVLAALRQRRTTRAFSDKPLPPQTISNLFWAAWGVNRPEIIRNGLPGRTAASAFNAQEIDLYAILPQGAYSYEARPHRLAPVAAGDLRIMAGARGTGTKPPLILVFVVDLARYRKLQPPQPSVEDPEMRKAYSNVAAGLIAGNVYLFAASQGLGACFHTCDAAALAKALKLRPDQQAIYAQTVGYPG